MKKCDREKLIKIYNKSLKNYGDDARSVHWRTESQLYRFNVLSEIDNLENASILDVGCGKGDLFGFLLAKGFRGSYEGIDINKNLVQLARKKYPNAKFRVVDITKARKIKMYDYILVSGMFNNKINVQ